VPRELTASFAGIPVNQPCTRVDDADYVPLLHGGFLHIWEYVVFVDFGNNVEDRLGHVKYLILSSVWCFGSLNAVVLSQNWDSFQC